MVKVDILDSYKSYSLVLYLAASSEQDGFSWAIRIENNMGKEELLSSNKKLYCFKYDNDTA